jgi:dUTP pyrophosphatase
MENTNSETPQNWEDIQEQVARIISSTGVEVDDDYFKELESLLGLNFDEMNKDVSNYLYNKVIQIEKIHPDAVTPKYAYQSDSGFDLYSVEKLTIPPFGRALVPTGLKLGFPDGFEIQVRPKSGLAINMGLTVLNTPGTVDHGYTGEIQVIVFNTNNNAVIIEKGMKIAQAVLCPVIPGKFVNFVEVDKLEDKDRGINGFGSTGVK